MWNYCPEVQNFTDIISGIRRWTVRTKSSILPHDAFVSLTRVQTWTLFIEWQSTTGADESRSSAVWCSAFPDISNEHSTFNWKKGCCILRGPGGERIVDVVPGRPELELQVNTLRTGLLNCLNARSRGLTIGTCVLYIGTGASLLSRERFLYI